MPAKSKAQQRFMGMVRAYQKGQLHTSSKQISDVAHSMSIKDVKDFATTKHDGLPEHVKDAATEFQMGLKEEAVHPVSTEIRKQIVRDHLKERSNYYTQMSTCMNKSSSCTEADPSIPKSFDQRQLPIGSAVKKPKPQVTHKTAFLVGFVKAASMKGFTQGQALDFLQKSLRQ